MRFHPRRLRFFVIVAWAMFAALPAPARSPLLHWEKMHVYHLLPSFVFAKLGLTHSTKNGHTRDGKGGVPDPRFPPGLTDVVPYDADHLLLVRGTTDGLNLFRSRVTAADVAVPPLHLKVELSQRSANGETVPDVSEQDGVQDTIPVQVSLQADGVEHVYQVTIRANPDGTFWVACRTSLPLPTPQAAPADVNAPGPVFVPERVWTDPQSRKVKIGETAVFDDRAVTRQAASRRLGVNGIDTAGDYIVRITLTPMSAPEPALPTPAPTPEGGQASPATQ